MTYTNQFYGELLVTLFIENVNITLLTHGKEKLYQLSQKQGLRGKVIQVRFLQILT